MPLAPPIPRRTAPVIFTVAIDGPAAAGKGTIARAVAERFGLRHLDTGLLYRAVALRTLSGEAPEDAARALAPEDVERPGLRAPEVSGRGLARGRDRAGPRGARGLPAPLRARRGGAVLDGRDIGTVVCPEAEVKLFVTASPEVRARRRHEELLAAGHDASYASVLADVEARDRRDRERAASPLRPAEGALTLDTSGLDIPEAVEAAARAVRAALR